MFQIYCFTNFFLKLKSNLLVRRVLLVNAAFAVIILNLILRVHRALFFIMLPKIFHILMFLIFQYSVCCPKILITLVLSTFVSIP